MANKFHLSRWHQCRDCKAVLMNNTPSVKYSTRHHLCADCAIKRGKDFLATLPTWMLTDLPAMALSKAGLFDWVGEEVERRKAADRG